MGTNRPQRRKKTNAEIKSDRVKRDAQKREADTLGWNDLDTMHQACNESMQTTGQRVAEILRLPDLKDKLGDDTPKVIQMGTELARDIRGFKATLNDIAAKHEHQKGAAKGLDGKMAVIVIGEEYHQWTDAFNTVVVQRSHDIMQRVEDAYFPPAAEEAPAQTPTGDIENVEH